MIGPWDEANAIYVEQGGVERRLRTRTEKWLVVWDVGMGIAANALATFAVAERLHRERTLARKLVIVSFEKELDGLRTALASRELFPFIQAYWRVIDELLARKVFTCDFAEWRFHEGSFFDHFSEAPRPELVYYDFFSPKSAPELWTLAVFRRLRALDLPILLTYTTSTAVRSALLLAGFNVGHGISTDAKLETTVAAMNSRELVRPLGRDWLEKLARSSRPLPDDIPVRERGLALERLHTHPQFCK